MHVPLIFLPSKPTPSQQVEDPAKSLPHPDEAAALLILGLGGYGVTAGPWNSSEPSRSWSMELHNFYGFLTPGGYSCSFSPSFKSNGEHRDWEGGSFLINKPRGKAYLRQGSGRNQFPRFLVKEVVTLPIPLAQGHGPREAESAGHRGWVCCIPNQFSSHGWCDCELWLDALPGSTARGETMGTNQTP